MLKIGKLKVVNQRMGCNASTAVSIVWKDFFWCKTVQSHPFDWGEFGLFKLSLQF